MRVLPFYEQLNHKLSALIEDETDWLANLSNATALLFMELDDINWAGFYLLRDNQLVLGPFQGKPACVRISIEKGVCGTAFAKKQTIVVPDVHQFPGHIVCDSASCSEIVVPLIAMEQKILGVLDIDSPSYNRFGDGDCLGLEQFVQILVNGTSWGQLLEMLSL